MSQGPGWWQASDLKWYPPETHPDYNPLPLPAPPSNLPPPPTRLPQSSVSDVVVDDYIADDAETDALWVCKDCGSEFTFLQTDEDVCPDCGGAVVGSTPAASPRRSHTALVLTLVIVVVLAAGGAAAYVLTRGPNTQTVTLNMVDYNGNCQTVRLEDGFVDGTPVAVQGDNGSHIATGALGSSSRGSATLNNGKTIPDCEFTSTVLVPGNQNTYTFAPSGGGAGIAFSHSELVDNGWVAGITYACPTNLQGGC